VLGIALFEIGVRAAKIDYNLSPNWKYHPVLGWSQVPGGTYDVVMAGVPLHVAFNRLGFRDVEHQRAKPPGTRRVVVIGDSFSEAVQVNLEETFHQVLQQLLNQADTTRWEVINVGVGDFGTAQEYLALLNYGLSFQPDVVIHEIFPLNDICNNEISLYDLCRSQNDRFRPYFVESGRDLVMTSAQPLRNWLRRHSVSYNTVEYWMLRLSGYNPQTADDPGRSRKLRRAGLAGFDPLLWTYADSRDQPAPVADGWRITERVIARIVDTTRARGAAYIGMVIPFEQALTDSAWDNFARLVHAPSLKRLYPEQRFSALFHRLGVGAVMINDAFQPYLPEVRPFVGGHFNASGHRRAAEALYREMVTRGLVGGHRGRRERTASGKATSP